ncbi:MAG TPA: hypothetical protein VI122_01760 [Thermoleophilaceae bacterium]
MPEPPEGEADLRTLARRYEVAERGIRDLLARAPSAADRGSLLKAALLLLVALRRLDARTPIRTAYLHEHRFGDPEAVADLAEVLHQRLDNGAQRASVGARRAFRMATEDNLEELELEAVTAHEQPDGRRWSLGHWAGMQIATSGRQSTSRGFADNVGEGGGFVVQGTKCVLCRTLFDGVKVVGRDRLPPGHPGCDCLAVRV